MSGRQVNFRVLAMLDPFLAWGVCMCVCDAGMVCRAISYSSCSWDMK